MPLEVTVRFLKISLPHIPHPFHPGMSLVFCSLDISIDSCSLFFSSFTSVPHSEIPPRISRCKELLMYPVLCSKTLVWKANVVVRAPWNFVFKHLFPSLLWNDSLLFCVLPFKHRETRILPRHFFPLWYQSACASHDCCHWKPKQ